MSPFSTGSGILWLAEYALKSTVVLGLALAAAALARRRAASLRHFILSLALLSLLVLPFFSLAPFGWETSVLPSRAAGSARSVDPAAAGLMPPEAAARPAGISSAAEASEAGFPFRSGSAGPIVTVAWAAGAALIIFRLAAGLMGARRLTRESRDVADPVWRVILERFLSAVGLRRRIRLKSHRDVAVPLTWGLFRPVILIPAEHGTWTDDQRSSVLFHELSHVKRADFLVLVLVRLSLAAFWFNPLSWAVFARIRKEQEKACDDLVLRAGVKPSTYAANLLLFKRAAGFRWNPSAALPGLFGGSSFNERLAAILRQRLAFKEITMKTKIMIASAIACVVVFIGCARPAAARVQTAPPEAVAAPAAPAAAPAPAQETKAVAQEKMPAAAEAQKKEAAKPVEKKINFVVKTDTETIPLEFIVVQDGAAKMVTLSDALTLKEGPEGRMLILNPGGKEIRLAGGGPVRIEVKGGEIEFVPGAGGLEKKIIISGGKAGALLKIGEDSAKLHDEIRKKIQIETDAEAAVKDVILKKIETEIGAREKVRDVIRRKLASEFDAQKMKALTEKIAVAPRARLTALTEDTAALQEQAKKIREMLNEVKEKKRDLADLDKAVSELEKALADREKEGAGRYRISAAPRAWTITKPDVKTEVRTIVKPDVVTDIRVRKEGGETVATVRPKARAEARAGALTVRTIEENGAATVVAVSGKGKTRADFERAVTQLKKDLPEGLTLEPEFEEAAGIITLTVRGSGKTGIPEDIVKKIAATLKDEMEE